MIYELQFLLALALTVVSEGAAGQILRRHSTVLRSIGVGRFMTAVAFASMLTLPYFWFLLPALGLPFLTYALLGEVVIFLVEAAFYKASFALSWRRCLLLSVVCNTTSILAGELMKMLW